MKKLKHIVTKLLVGFVLISIGYIWGKHSVEKGTTITPQQTGDYVQVYYMHGTKRCRKCNTIQAMTSDVVTGYYSELLKTEKLKLSHVNFQKDSALAKQFGVMANCVVVAKVHNGKVASYERLDDIWTTMKSKVVYDSYICTSINKLLEPEYRAQPLAPMERNDNLIIPKSIESPWKMNTPLLYKELQK